MGRITQCKSLKFELIGKFFQRKKNHPENWWKEWFYRISWAFEMDINFHIHLYSKSTMVFIQHIPLLMFEWISIYTLLMNTLMHLKWNHTKFILCVIANEMCTLSFKNLFLYFHWNKCKMWARIFMRPLTDFFKLILIYLIMS